MFCYFCQNLIRQTPLYRQKGVQISRTSTLQRHADYKEHEDAADEEAMRDIFSNRQHRVFNKTITNHPHNEDIATVRYDSLLNSLGEAGLESVKNLPVGGMQDAIATTHLKRMFLLACLYECEKKVE